MKMFDNSNTRIFLQGNEDVARWHLPVVLSRFKAFVSRCKNSGLKQDRFTMTFEEDGTVVFGQYFYGEESIQIYSPVRSIIIEEKSINDLSATTEPKTFFINTTQGYFWIEVRYDDEGLPVVLLTKFKATKSSDGGITEEFIYPGMGMQSFGMLAGCVGNVPSQRYVLTQSGGVMIGEGEEKGTIKLPSTGGGNARITVSKNDTVGGFFCILENADGKVAQVKVISVDLLADELVVEMKHGVIDMLVETEAGNITSENFPKTPTYIHRKCTGSYFSPNKTIGYHVDAGSDDGYHGNTFAIPPGAQDKLDNGMEGEYYFNHTKDLYGIASLFATPIEFSKTTVSLVMVSPTLVWSVIEHDDLCWGGYGETQTYAGCIDLQGDFTSNILSPRPCLVNFSLASMEVTAFDLPSVELELDSWCGVFGATTVSTILEQCGPKFYYEKTELDDIAPPCSWIEDGTGICDQQQGTSYEVESAAETSYKQHWVKNFKENIIIKRKAEFRFGGRQRLSTLEQRYINPYFLFDGLWHLDFGVMYLTNPGVSATCRLCAIPPFSQDPGELVYFMYQGEDTEWVLTHGHEFVRNLDIVEPLGIYIMPDNSPDGVGEYLGFIARVPESLAAPHEPEVLTGGVSYPSEGVEGEVVNCEYSLMSAPCICDTPPAWGEFSSELALLGTVPMYFDGGCPPFSWTGGNVSFVDHLGVNIPMDVLKKSRSAYVKSTNACYGSVKVYEVCGENLVNEKSVISVDGVVTGPTELDPGESGTYYHNLGPTAVYIGDLTVVSIFNGGAVLSAPEDNPGYYTVQWEVNECSRDAVMTVAVDPPCDGSVPSSGLGNPVGMRIRNSIGNCGFVTSTVYALAFISADCPDGNVASWSAGIGTNGVVVCIRYTPNVNQAGWCRRELLTCTPG